MKVIDLTSRAAERAVQLDPSPIYDLLAALFVVENWGPERGFEVERRWVQEARAALGGALRDDLRLFVRERGFLLGLCAFLAGRRGVGVPEFLKLLAAVPPRELIERLLTAPRAARAAGPLLREALRTRRPQAVAAFLAAYPEEFDASRVRTMVTLPPAEVQHRLVRLLRTFYGKVYLREEPRVAPLLRADVEAKQAQARTLPPDDLVERATGGIAVGVDPEITRIVLAPSFFSRPYNLIAEYPGVRLFVYPVGLDAAAPEAEARELGRVFKAIGDETRLRILQLLAEREMYLQEIANRLGVSHVTAIHHLALLRAARLVRVVERSGLKYYRLRPEAAAEVGARLLELVGGTAGGAR
jgi:DNA-binding transcriptional ArsR family regulator